MMFGRCLQLYKDAHVKPCPELDTISYREFFGVTSLPSTLNVDTFVILINLLAVTVEVFDVVLIILVVLAVVSSAGALFTMRFLLIC